MGKYSLDALFRGTHQDLLPGALPTERREVAINHLAPCKSITAMLLVLVLTHPLTHGCVNRNTTTIAGALFADRKILRATTRYRLDATQSTFIAHALRGGLLWFKGHDHLIAVREFTGEAELLSSLSLPEDKETRLHTCQNCGSL